MTTMFENIQRAYEHFCDLHGGEDAIWTRSDLQQWLHAEGYSFWEGGTHHLDRGQVEERRYVDAEVISAAVDAEMAEAVR